MKHSHFTKSHPAWQLPMPIARCLLPIAYCLLMSASYANAGITGKENPPLKNQARQWLSEKQIGFQENKGQMTDMQGKPVNDLLFKTDAGGVTMYITTWGLSYVFIKMEEEAQPRSPQGREKEEAMPFAEKKENTKIEYCRADMELKNASIKKENIVKEYESADYYNYYLGHCPDGILNVRRYEKITIKEVYPKIDWVIYTSSTPLSFGEGAGGGVKYDFVVHPGGDPDKIILKYLYTDKPDKKDDGSLSIKAPMGNITDGSPYSYIQETNAQVQTAYTINKETGEIHFTTEHYNPEQTLIIDPALFWATFYGSNDGNEGPLSITTDNSGNVFVTGYVIAANFPVLNPVQGTFAGSEDIFILKFTNTGALLWATYYGGNSYDAGWSIIADNSGNVFVTGYTYSSNFPVFNPLGGAYFQGTPLGGEDIFILKFNSAGVQLWATYYGGSGTERGRSITTDNSGNVLVTGNTGSSIFPVLNPVQGTNAGGDDAFILKFTNAGVPLWATYYGGSGTDWGWSITTDNNSNVLVTGSTSSSNFPVLNPGGGAYFQGTTAGSTDAFILKLTDAGLLLWATCYGGSGFDWGNSIITDNNGNVFVAGEAGSSFPVQNPGGGAYFQGGGGVFISKFNNADSLLWATCYNDGGAIVDIKTDGCGNIYMSFETNMDNVSVQNSCDGGYFDPSNNGGWDYDIVIVLFDNNGVRLWATYLGGNGVDFRDAIAVDGNNNLFVTGEWTNQNSGLTNSTYPLVNPAGGAYYDGTFNGGDDDAYIVKFLSAPCLCSNAPVVSVSSVAILCNGQCMGTASAAAAGGSSPYTYLWSNSQTTQTITGLCAGTYSVLVTDASIATATATVAVTQPSPLTATATVTNATCGSNNGTAAVSASGGSPSYTYSWNPGGQTTSAITGLGAGAYTATINDSNACDTTQIVIVVSSGSATVTNQPASICSGSTYTLPGGTVVSTGGAYTDTLTSVAGCDSIITTTLTVNPNPIATATATATPASITIGASTTLSATGGGTYSWSPPDGLSCTTCANPTVTPIWGAGGLIYCVTVTDANNCTDTACITVTIEPLDCSGELYLPNTFSPNGDGENDVLQVYYGNILCIKTLHIIIYDRWGEKVFETTNPSEGWDGTYRSASLTTGAGRIMHTQVFVYYMEATLISGEKINRKRNISLIR